MIVAIYIGADRVDLFEDEGISVTSSVADIGDVTKNTTDYSKVFTVPASETNNKIFKRYYNANVDNSFDARTKVSGRIELRSQVFRDGQFLLQKVQVKKRKPTSYTINFTGNLVSIADLVGKAKLSSLDLSAHDHAFTSANVKTGLQSSLSSANIIYNLFVKKQYYYNENITDGTHTETLSNIYGGTTLGTENGVHWNELRPSIKLNAIITAIETDYGIRFSSHFFNTTAFDNLFMWCSNDTEEVVGAGTSLVDFVSGSVYMDLATNIGTYYSYFDAGTPATRTWHNLTLYVTAGTVTPDVPYTIKMYVNGILGVEKEISSGNGLISLYLYNDGINEINKQYDVYFEIFARSEFIFTTSLKQEKWTANGLNYAKTYSTSTGQTVAMEFVITDNLPDIEIIAFLKGLFNKYKLIIIPTSETDFYVNTIDGYYSEGGLYDITDFVDFEDYDVSRGEILNKISYKFSEPQTILAKTFKTNNNGVAYGDIEVEMKDANGKLLDGDSVDIELPFEQIIYEKLTNQNNGADTDIVCGAIIDEELKGVNVKPHIFYNIYQDIGTAIIGFYNDLGTRESVLGGINTPSHTIDNFTRGFSTVFGEEYSEQTGTIISQTLYVKFHKEYIEKLFNIKRRNFVFQAKKLPLRVALNLKLNDILLIDRNYYRIDKFTINLLTQETEFNLVNHFFAHAYDTALNSFNAATNNVLLTYGSQVYRVYITNLKNFSTTKTDTGDGTAWANLYYGKDSTLSIDVTENLLAPRNMRFTVTNDDTLQTLEIYLEQEKGSGYAYKPVPAITSDDTITTSDNVIETSDNN